MFYHKSSALSQDHLCLARPSSPLIARWTSMQHRWVPDSSLNRQVDVNYELHLRSGPSCGIRNHLTSVKKVGRRIVWCVVDQSEVASQIAFAWAIWVGFCQVLRQAFQMEIIMLSWFFRESHLLTSLEALCTYHLDKSTRWKSKNPTTATVQEGLSLRIAGMQSRSAEGCSLSKLDLFVHTNAHVYLFCTNFSS